MQSLKFIKIFPKKFPSNLRKVSNNSKRVLLQDEDKITEFTYKTSNENRTFVWGLSETGALGIQNSLKKHAERYVSVVQHPTRLHFGEKHKVLDLTAGYGFSLFIVEKQENISLFGTGINTDSQIGFHKHGGITNKPLELLIAPVPIELPSKPNEDLKVKKVGAGRAHTVILTDNGIVFTLGNNSYGQCGRKIVEDEKYSESLLFHRIEKDQFDFAEVCDVICGQDHTLFITESGAVFSCGWGADGQTGLGHYNSIDTPTLVRGEIFGEKIKKIASSGDCVLALNDKGEVFGWGNSEYGQIEHQGQQQYNSPIHLKSTKACGKIIDIAAGGSFSLILNENGDVFVWGFGLLGFGPQADCKFQPTQIPPTLFGRNEFNPENRVTSIYSGLYHMGAINNDEDLFMWGRNKYGCLGLGHQKDQYFPFKACVGAKVKKISCGADHTLALCKPFI